MRYFDALISSSFRTAQDGRKLFFPFGILGRGYVIAVGPDYRRLRMRFKISAIILYVVMIGLVVSFPSLGHARSYSIAALVIAFHLAWTLYLVRGLQSSNKRLSRKESVAAWALASDPVKLWVLELFALALTGGGIWTLVVRPRVWFAAAVLIIIGGLYGVTGAWTLVLRRQGQDYGGQ